MNAHPRIQTFCCPTCGGFIGEAAPLDKVAESVTSAQQIYIFKALAKKPGKALPRAVLYDALYRHRKIRPTDPSHNFTNLITKLRRKIEPHGWTIHCANGATQGGLSMYRLIPLEANP